MSRPGVIKSLVADFIATVLLFLSVVAIPVVGVLWLPLVPQPALAFGVKHGRGKAVGLLVGTLLLFMMVSKGLAIGFSILALMVILLCFSFGRGWSIESVVAGSAAAMLAVVSAALFYFFRSWSVLREVTLRVLSENLEISLDIYQRMGLSAERAEVLREQTRQTVELMIEVLPALAFASFVIVILINLFFLYRRFPDKGSFFACAGDLKEWKAPEPLVWCFIASGFSLFLPGLEAFHTLALNIFLVTAFFYFFQGLAIVAYYLNHRDVPFFLRSLTYAFIILERVLTLLVVGLGLFDLWGDFRRLKKKDLNPSQVS